MCWPSAQVQCHYHHVLLMRRRTIDLTCLPRQQGLQPTICTYPSESLLGLSA